MIKHRMKWASTLLKPLPEEKLILNSSLFTYRLCIKCNNIQAQIQAIYRCYISIMTDIVSPGGNMPLPGEDLSVLNLEVLPWDRLYITRVNACMVCSSSPNQGLTSLGNVLGFVHCSPHLTEWSGKGGKRNTSHCSLSLPQTGQSPFWWRGKGGQPGSSLWLPLPTLPPSWAAGVMTGKPQELGTGDQIQATVWPILTSVPRLQALNCGSGSQLGSRGRVWGLETGLREAIPKPGAGSCRLYCSVSQNHF